MGVFVDDELAGNGRVAGDGMDGIQRINGMDGMEGDCKTNEHVDGDEGSPHPVRCVAPSPIPSPSEAPPPPDVHGMNHGVNRMAMHSEMMQNGDFNAWPTSLIYAWTVSGQQAMEQRT